MPSKNDSRDCGVAPELRRVEMANSISHGAGLALSIGGAVTLFLVAGLKKNGWRSASCNLYATTLVAMYAASTMSHAFQAPKRRRFFRILDQSMIFLLIAGTYTPFALIQVDVGWWPIFALVWGVALAGFFCKILSGQERLGVGSMLTYLLLGWLPGVVLVPVLYEAQTGGVWWLVSGGLCYTLGTVFLALDKRIRYGHLMWHLFVIAGSGCHYVAILLYAGSPI